MIHSTSPMTPRRIAAAAALAALFALGGQAHAAPVSVLAEYIFSDIQLTVSDLDPTDAYLPSLTPRADGGFDNTGSSVAQWRPLSAWRDTSEGQATDPLPDGGLFDVGNSQAELNGSFASVLSGPDGSGTRITLRAGVNDSAPEQVHTSFASLTMGPASSGSASPAYSFTLGAMSQATFSMRVDHQLTGTGLVEPFAAGGGVGFWEVNWGRAGEIDHFTPTGYDSFGMDGSGPDQSSSKQVSYSILNSGTEAMEVALHFRSDVQAWTITPPVEVPVVPEPETWAMGLAGLALVAARGLLGARAGKRG